MPTQAAPREGEEVIRVSEYFDGSLKIDDNGERLYHTQTVCADDVDVGDLIFDPVLSATQIFAVIGVVHDNGKAYICVSSKSKPHSAEMLELFCSKKVTVLIDRPDFCPKCNEPFEEFLPMQVCRDWWEWKVFWARIFNRPRPGFWALICHSCKHIVSYY